MASKKEYEADSPLSYDVEEGELVSGRSSPGTIRENASECITKTDDNNETMTTMRVEVDNCTPEQQKNSTQKQPTPLEIARIIAERTVRPKASNVRKNLESFRTRKNDQYNQTEPEIQKRNKPSYQNGRAIKTQSNHSVKYASPPMPIHTSPVRPPPLTEDFTDNHHRMQQHVQQQWFERNSAHIRPNNLRFPYDITPRNNNRKSSFHQSVNQQSPTQIVSDTIWFTELDPRTLTNPHIHEYNPLFS